MELMSPSSLWGKLCTTPKWKTEIWKNLGKITCLQKLFSFPFPFPYDLPLLLLRHRPTSVSPSSLTPIGLGLVGGCGDRPSNWSPRKSSACVAAGGVGGATGGGRGEQRRFGGRTAVGCVGWWFWLDRLGKQQSLQPHTFEGKAFKLILVFGCSSWNFGNLIDKHIFIQKYSAK